MEEKELEQEISAFRRRILEKVRAIKVFEPENKSKTYENGFRNGNNSAIELALGHIEKEIEGLEQKISPPLSSPAQKVD